MNLRLIGEFVNKNITISESLSLDVRLLPEWVCGSLEHQVSFFLP